MYELYFPRNLTIATAPDYTGISVQREKARGPVNNPGSRIPDVVTVQRHAIQDLQMRNT